MRPTAILRAAGQTTQRRPVPTAGHYRWFMPFQTRWNDNDSYSHCNNVLYNEYFDSIINSYLINQVGMPLPGTPKAVGCTLPIGLAVHSETNFSASLEYPQPVIAAIAVKEIGRSSVTWEAALFAGEYVSPEGTTDGGCWLHRDGAEGVTLGAEGGEVSFGKQVKLVGGMDAKAAAHGTFKHVFVGRESRRTVDLPSEMREVVERLMVKRD